MKNIVICADGTWNSPLQPVPSNVLQLSRAIGERAADGSPQVVFYDWGIGSYYDSVKGGVSGVGMEKNIKDCYRFLVHNYRPRDALYFFGFSRGAFTVRSLAGFIRNCGLIRQEHANRIEYAFDTIYKNRLAHMHPESPTARAFRATHSHADRIPIRFIGVFDTVGRLGVPITFWGMLDNDEHLFHDLEPSSIVQTARHALALDETRKDFKPALWDAKAGIDIQQVWFSGNHSDVGGGHEDDHRLADISLQWMIDEAHSAGLGISEHLPLSLDPHPGAPEHDSYSGIYRLRGRRYYRQLGPDPLVHASVVTRHRLPQIEPSHALSKHLEQHARKLADLATTGRS